jgi:hypothetical protein
LVTRPSTMASDLRLFRQWATMVRACRIHDVSVKGKPFSYGPAPDCPRQGVFF